MEVFSFRTNRLSLASEENFGKDPLIGSETISPIVPNQIHQPECWDGKPLGRTKQGNLMALLSVNRLQSDILRELWIGATNRVCRIASD